MCRGSYCGRVDIEVAESDGGGAKVLFLTSEITRDVSGPAERKFKKRKRYPGLEPGTSALGVLRAAIAPVPRTTKVCQNNNYENLILKVGRYLNDRLQ